MKNQKLWLAVFIAAAVAVFGWKACHAGAHNCSLGDRIVQGFALTAGFRWDQECPDPTVCAPPPSHPKNVDPAFVGAELRIPISARTTLGGNFDRDWTDAPDWNARVYVSFAPWKRVRR